MTVKEILESIDKEISRLQRARALLAEETKAEQSGKRRGRPKGSRTRVQSVSAPLANKTAKRRMSPEGKARIAAAQKLRWAKQKKALRAAKKTGSAPARAFTKSGAKKGLARKTSAAKKTAAPSEATSAARSATSPA